MKILLFGGAFDPFHMGHHQMLRAAIEQWAPDQTFVIPTKQKWWSERWLSPAEHRIKMIEMSIRDLPNVHLDPWEINQSEPQPWIATLRHFRARYPDAEFAFLVGTDQYERLEEWTEFAHLLPLAQILVYPRDCHTPKHHVDAQFLVGEPVSVSSTMIRTAPRPGMVSPEVLAYIGAWGLYAPERVQAACKTEKRYQHCLRVGVYAERLMRKIDPASAHLAMTAGIYHDICKEMPEDEQVRIAETEIGIHSYVSWRVLHGPVGAWLIEQHFLVHNPAVLNAVRRHTKPFDFGEPTPLDKIVYLADKLEPMRTNDDVYGESIDAFRALAEVDYEACFTKLYNLLEGKY